MSYSRIDELIEALRNKDFFALDELGVTAVHFVFTNSDSIEFAVYTKDYDLYTIELKQEEFKG